MPILGHCGFHGAGAPAGLLAGGLVASEYMPSLGMLIYLNGIHLAVNTARSVIEPGPPGIDVAGGLFLHSHHTSFEGPESSEVDSEVSLPMMRDVPPWLCNARHLSPAKRRLVPVPPWIRNAGICTG